MRNSLRSLGVIAIGLGLCAAAALAACPSIQVTNTWVNNGRLTVETLSQNYPEAAYVTAHYVDDAGNILPQVICKAGIDPTGHSILSFPNNPIHWAVVLHDAAGHILCVDGEGVSGIWTI